MQFYVRSLYWRDRGHTYAVPSRYGVSQQVSDIGLVDFEFCCSTFCLFLLALMGNWQNWLNK